jgi:hypothetical protein
VLSLGPFRPNHISSTEKTRNKWSESKKLPDGHKDWLFLKTSYNGAIQFFKYERKTRMKIRLFTLSAFSFIALMAQAQTLLYNDGATVTIQPGATLYVEGGVTNTASGTINNDGTLEVKGDFLNQGNWDATDLNTIKFSGDANSNVTSGSAIFRNVVIAKGSGFNVNLMDPMTVNTNLDFASLGGARLVTGGSDLFLPVAATITGFDSDEYIAANGAGMVQKSITGNGTYLFPIGDIVNYSPLSMNVTGSGYASAYLRARVTDMIHPEKPEDATDFISRYWDIEASGITGYDNALTGTYVLADVHGTASLIKGTVYNNTEWSYDDSNVGSSTVLGTTMDLVSDFTGTNFFGEVTLRAYLDGAYSSSTMQMSTTLNSLGLIPLISPYADAPDTVATIPADVTDWVKLELREVSNPSVVIGRGSAFIKNDGSIIGTDGSPVALIKNGTQNSIVAIIHRNHLPIRTNIGIDVVNSSLIDFTTDLSLVFDNGLDNLPMNIVGGKNTLWSCDATGSTNLINSTDFSFVKAQSTSAPSGYLRADVNLSGAVNSTDLSRTKAFTTIPKAADF